MLNESSVAVLPAIKNLVLTNLSGNMLNSLIILLIVIVMYFIGKRIINRRCNDKKSAHSWRLRWFYFVSIITIFLVCRVWISGFQQIITLLTVMSAALIVTQKELLTNFIACLYINMRKPFKLGDRIKIKDSYGYVTNIGVQCIECMECDLNLKGDQTTGRTIKIPNAMVLSDPLINFTEIQSHSWHEIQLRLAYGQLWETTQSFMTQTLHQLVKPHYAEVEGQIDETANSKFIVTPSLNTEAFVKVDTSTPQPSVCITLRFLCSVIELANIENMFWKKVLPYLHDNHIQLAQDNYHMNAKSTVDEPLTKETARECGNQITPALIEV